MQSTQRGSLQGWREYSQVLNRPGEQPIGDFPEIRVLVAISELIAKVHGVGEGCIEPVGRFGIFLFHREILADRTPSNARPASAPAESGQARRQGPWGKTKLCCEKLTTINR